MKFNDFEIITRSRSVPIPVSSRDDLERLSIALLRHEVPVRKPVRLLGVSLSSLHVDDHDRQLGLAHRAKNQLAVVKGMALQTARQSATVDDFIAQFDRRIQGLAQSQDLLLRQNWRGAWMSDLVHAHLEPFGAEARAQIGGPAAFLDTSAVQNVGFALHELATNASKYGALSTDRGRIVVAWSLLADGAVRLEWSEHDGPPFHRQRQGFGHRVMTELVPRALNGVSTLDLTSHGIRWALTIPAAHIVRDSGQSLQE